MYREQKFFICGHCGNLTGLVLNGGVPMVCCGREMTELIANTAAASAEKHLPSITFSGDTVSVQAGSVPHPMEDAHNIAFVYLETLRGGQRKSLKAGEKPSAEFKLVDDMPVAVYAYCNLHGLWKTVLNK